MADLSGDSLSGVPLAALFDDVSPTAASEDTVRAVRMSSRRELYVQLRDAAGNERGLNIGANNEVKVNLGYWNGTAPDAPAALADAGSVTPTVPKIGAVMMGIRSTDASPTNLDRAVLPKLFDRDTGANTENVLGASIRVGASGGSVEAGIIDNAGFTDGTSPVLPMGFILDEVAGTALSENDTAAARIDSKRAQVFVLEDATTRGTRQTVTAGLAGLVTPYFSNRTDTYTTTANGTTVDVTANPVKYFGLQVIQTGTVTSWTVVLEGSLDGATWTTILTHSSTIGSTVWQAAPANNPVRYFRSRCSALSLGAGTNVIAYILGMN